MTSEFSTVVSCNRLDVLFEWRQQMYYSTCQLFGIFPFLSFLINSMFVLRSISVTMAPWFPLPTIVSISKSPKRFPFPHIPYDTMVERKNAKNHSLQRVSR